MSYNAKLITCGQAIPAMNWYDLIAPLYDIGATGSGGPRRHAVDRLLLQPGDIVLDVACGTGLNFQLVRNKIGPDGLLIGLDFSSGMLVKARRKAERDGWQNVRLIRADARTVSAELLSEHGRFPGVDKVLCTLGLSVVPDWEEVFRRSWALLTPGGRYAIMDWYVEGRNPFSWFLNRISQGDVSRRSWAPLRREAEDYSHQTFVFENVFVAAGTKPAGSENRPAV